jgi:hypothetical protein
MTSEKASGRRRADPIAWTFVATIKMQKGASSPIVFYFEPAKKGPARTPVPSVEIALLIAESRLRLMRCSRQKPMKTKGGFFQSCNGTIRTGHFARCKIPSTTLPVKR